MAAPALADPLQHRLARYPRMRFMGSKHRLAPRLADVFATLPPGPAVDAFSGSGVVAYTLKATGRQVLANDHLAFAAAFTRAMVANDDVLLTPADVDLLCSPNRDGRDFIQRTFDGLYFPAADHAFLDAAWSHLDDMDATTASAGGHRALPRRGAQAAARRLHDHDAALRRRAPSVADESPCTVP